MIISHIAIHPLSKNNFLFFKFLLSPELILAQSPLTLWYNKPAEYFEEASNASYIWDSAEVLPQIENHANGNEFDYQTAIDLGLENAEVYHYQALIYHKQKEFKKEHIKEIAEVIGNDAYMDVASRASHGEVAEVMLVNDSHLSPTPLISILAL